MRSVMTHAGYDAVLLLGMVNIRYLCGFCGTDGALVVTHNQVFFLTDSRYTSQAKQQVDATEIVEYSDKLQAVGSVLRDTLNNRGSKVGFESKLVSVDQFQRLEKECSACGFIAADDEIVGLRQIKDDDEIVCLTQAAHLNHLAWSRLLPEIKTGSSEADIALELEFILRKLGGEDKAFDFIVASGERGAMPHGVASSRQLQRGDLVTVDFGTKWQGYHSDETVTFGVGEVSHQLRKIYDVVLEAHDRALSSIELSASAREIDNVARQYIAEQGYGSYFGHGLGHGVGLEVHEAPVISPRSEVLLQAGMVFTIEPGIYIPGVGGVRIEDTVVLTDDGCRCLTQCPKHYLAIS